MRGNVVGHTAAIARAVRPGWWLLVLSLIVFGTTSHAAQTGTFTGTGKAVVIEGDKETALKIAKEAAVRKAVSLAMESLIEKGTEDERKFNLNKGELLQKPYPFLTKAEIVSKELLGKVLTISVKIHVDNANLSKFLAQKGVLARKTLKRRKAEFPSMMVLLVEEISGKVNAFPFSTTVVTGELLKREYDVVDETVVRKSIKHDQAVQGVLNGDNRAALAVALQYGAGILITGRAVAQKSGMKAGGMQAHGANVAMQAVRADSGKILASASADGTYPHIDAITGSRKAIEEASRKALARVLEELKVNLEQAEESVLVSISGINYSQLAILKKILSKEFAAISSIRQQSFTGGVAKLDVDLDGSPSDFSEQVALKDFGTFRLDVLHYSPGKMDFVLKMKDGGGQ
jgi:hypothetical protein